ncbi:hypothetical protein FF38_05573 [Lucilia cuprina]|uniref:Uncharacterized protein n=1 Tax=Lucilia cuprina TaxID=7375 RepID=A0A0L0CEB5_LUCCU|nr:hypothetical protein FF38_05573 [Lucilia cuprina]
MLRILYFRSVTHLVESVMLPPQKRSKRSRAFSSTSVAVVRAVEAVVVVVELEDEDKLAACCCCCCPPAAADEANITSTSNMGSSRTLMVVPGTGFLLALFCSRVFLPTSVVGLPAVLLVVCVGDLTSLLLLLFLPSLTFCVTVKVFPVSKGTVQLTGSGERIIICSGLLTRVGSGGDLTMGSSGTSATGWGLQLDTDMAVSRPSSVSSTSIRKYLINNPFS